MHVCLFNIWSACVCVCKYVYHEGKLQANFTFLWQLLDPHGTLSKTHLKHLMTLHEPLAEGQMTCCTPGVRLFSSFGSLHQFANDPLDFRHGFLPVGVPGIWRGGTLHLDIQVDTKLSGAEVVTPMPEDL